jgi:hypothetical protein
MAEANKSYAVVGNNGLQTATLIPDLTQSIDSSFLKIEQNVEKLNCWQPIFTSDLIADSFRQEEFPVSTSGDFRFGTDYVVTYDFYLKGWTQLKQIVLQWALALNVNSNVSGTAATQFYGMAVPSSQDQSDYTWLDVIQNLDIRIGNNNFMLTNQELHSLYGIKHLALASTKTLGEAQAMSSFGLNSARTSALSFTEKSWSDWQFPYLNIPGRYTNSDCWNFKSTDENAKYYDHFYTNLSKFDNGITGILPTSYSTKIFALPISMVNSFFNQQDTWLPKGLRIQIQITFDNNRTYYTGNGETKISKAGPTEVEVRSAGFLINQLASGTLSGLFPTSLKCTYEYSNLRFEIQENLNKLWLERPFVYNYYEWDVYKTDLPAASNPPYIIDFKQNSQRPLDIWICVRNTKRNDFMYSAITNAANTNPVNNSTRFQIKKYGLCPVVYQSVKIFINGREYINNDLLGTTNQTILPGDGLSCDDVINALIFESCDQESTQTSSSTIRPLSRAINFDNVYPYQITIAPNNFFQRGTYPVDQGAVNVRIELNCTFVAPTGAVLSPTWPYAGATLFVYSRRAAQLTLDGSHQCVQVSWPLVVSNNSAVATPSINKN